MKTTIDSPGVAIPPPLFYIAAFLLSLLLQKLIPITPAVFRSTAFEIAGIAIVAVSLIFTIPALLQFLKTKNTIILIKPANSLQTSGIYSRTRNPMYCGLLLLYIGLALLIGNWWTLILMPLLILVVTQKIIKPEERYLLRAFGEPYLSYKEKVRRWI
ncbi:MAG TPA: isoprenylcysteine carboxylmethyltransferase family protein [Mucilaginibacter sp.]|jgi:protein-S-isoprenylcysteine O-methyltransferase Ste14|nr:isoprenylcysteine carboxylmethyltransferase family protein [Mucilaginibacter sp.]